MTQQQRDIVSDALRQRFNAERVDFEQVGPNGRYRFGVVSAEFEQMPHLRRQDAAWEVVDQVLDRETSLDVSLLITLAPGDLTLA